MFSPTPCYDHAETLLVDTDLPSIGPPVLYSLVCYIDGQTATSKTGRVNIHSNTQLMVRVEKSHVWEVIHTLHMNNLVIRAINSC